MEEKSNCQQCSLYNNYKKVVISEGNAKDPIFMIVGEGPGEEEVKQNRPFVGRAGQKLRQVLKKNRKTFNISTTLISNVLGCRPLNNKFPDCESTVKTCVDLWLYREIELVKPKIIITLGNPALKYVGNMVGITKYRGKWRKLPKFNCWTFATFHPSYVLRRQDDGRTENMFCEDFETIASEWKNHLQ